MSLSQFAALPPARVARWSRGNPCGNLHGASWTEKKGTTQSSKITFSGREFFKRRQGYLFIIGRISNFPWGLTNGTYCLFSFFFRFNSIAWIILKLSPSRFSSCFFKALDFSSRSLIFCSQISVESLGDAGLKRPLRLKGERKRPKAPKN